LNLNFIKKIVLLCLAVLFIAIGLKYQGLFTLESLKSAQDSLNQQVEQQPFLTALLYFILYVVLTAVSFPGATILTLASGAMFGVIGGFLLVSFASTIGASVNFLFVRYTFADWARSKFTNFFESFDAGLSKDGLFYLLTLRLIPIFPFFVVNSVSGLSNLKLRHFYLVSQIGMIPGTLIYVWAGSELAQIQSVDDILSFKLILSLTVLGLFPFVAKGLLNSYKIRKIYSKYTKPHKFDYNLVVIGGGAAGLVSTAIAANTKAKVAIIEMNKMGGDCLNYGCVPSKALLHLSKSNPAENFQEIRNKIKNAIKKIEPNDSKERFEKMGATVFTGQARIKTPWTVQVNGQELTTRSIIIASGAEPRVPNIPGLDKAKTATSETIWDLETLPAKILVVGGGAIGCELSQAFARLGTKVTLIERADRLISSEEPEASLAIETEMQKLGVAVHKKSQILSVNSSSQLTVENDNGAIQLDYELIFFALGRVPRTKGFGLEELSIQTNERGFVASDNFLQTQYPNIFVCGDAAGPIQLTHVAGHQAWYASVNALFGDFKKFKQSLDVIPRCIFTCPEVASVGLTTKQAADKYGVVDVVDYPMAESDRAITEYFSNGFIKIITKPNSDKILGVTIVAPCAGEMLAEFTLAMNNNLGLKKILSTVHAYPTWSDSNKMAALSWQRKNIPKKLQKIAEAFHAWKRG
jgi:pyruvate/2-oxoglutarate dehydrogenase complex dihydrolipoamide dehydrogenase (E3) component/uncharacterized membrane protein YdjX (TVP38/TMEM64 family)